EKQRVYIRPSDYGAYTGRRSETTRGFLERNAFRIPEERIRIRRVGDDIPDPPGYDKAAARCRTLAAFMGVAALNDEGGSVEAVLKKFLIRFDHEPRRDPPVGIGEHAVGGYDSESFDAEFADHLLCYPENSDLSSLRLRSMPGSSPHAERC